MPAREKLMKTERYYNKLLAGYYASFAVNCCPPYHRSSCLSDEEKLDWRVQPGKEETIHTHLR